MADVALFVHSTGVGPFMWNKLLVGLPEGIAPLTPTNRGYSPSDLLARGTPFSLQDEVAHLKAQIPEGTTGVHLGGHSYGGLVALSLAMDPAVPVRSLWLYEPVLFGSLNAEADTLQGEVAEQVRALFTDREPFAHYRLSVPTTLVYGEHTQPPAAEMVRRLATVNPHADVTELKGQGHMAVVGAPDAVLPTLQAHWARVVAGQASAA